VERLRRRARRHRGLRDRGILRGLDREQAVADLRQRFDVARVAGIVAERRPELGDGAREDLVVHHPPRPDVFEEVSRPHDLSRLGREPQEDVHEKRPEPLGAAAAAKLARGRQHLEFPEGEGPVVLPGGFREMAFTSRDSRRSEGPVRRPGKYRKEIGDGCRARGRRLREDRSVPFRSFR
jgi:hypothetical protein